MVAKGICWSVQTWYGVQSMTDIFGWEAVRFPITGKRAGNFLGSDVAGGNCGHFP
jgi:hypothetical protein